MGFGKDGKGVILAEAPEIVLGTLAAKMAIRLDTNVIGIALLERFRLIKTEVQVFIRAASFVAGDGPIGLYLVDADFTLAEFEEALESVGSVGPNDKVTAAQVERFYKAFGMINFVEENAAGGALMSKGLVVSEMIRWTFARAKGWNWMAYNFGGALTTGSTIVLQCKHFGVWVI